MNDTNDAEVNTLFEPFLNNFSESQFVEAGESVVIPGPCTLQSRTDGTFLVRPVLAPGTQDAVHESDDVDTDYEDNYNVKELYSHCSLGRISFYDKLSWKPATSWITSSSR